MQLLTDALQEEIQREILGPALMGHCDDGARASGPILDELYAAIPPAKRISYGRVHCIKVLAGTLHAQLVAERAPVVEIACGLYAAGQDFRGKGVALGVLSSYGPGDYAPVLPYFEAAAADEDWDTRELAQMFFRRLIKQHPDEMHGFLLRLVGSDSAYVRRFVAETLRPVQENQWFYRQPDYPVSILRHLFQERAAYPRTSVGNNLSDLARRLPELVYGLVEELVASGDRNSYWIACRACRNLVKRDRLRVLDALHADEYRYKKARYLRDG